MLIIINYQLTFQFSSYYYYLNIIERVVLQAAKMMGTQENNKVEGKERERDWNKKIHGHFLMNLRGIINILLILLSVKCFSCTYASD